MFSFEFHAYLYQFLCSLNIIDLSWFLFIFTISGYYNSL